MELNNHLRPQWKRAGYPAGMGSAAVVPPPPEKYRRVYHLTSAEYAITNIVFNRLKVARFFELNDPFELLALRPVNSSVRDTIRAHKDELNKKTGVLCFSADWIDPVLWSHYGVKHRGICLGFNLAKTIAHEVSYQTNRLTNVLAKNITTIDDSLAALLLCTKFDSWKYEKEWRVAVPLAEAKQEGKMHFVGFNDELQLAEVIV